MIGKRYELRILPLFEDDLNEIVDYIAYRLRNPVAAERLVDDVEAAIEERRSCAEAFEPYPSSRRRVIDGTMEVRRILYSRSDIRKKL